MNEPRSTPVPARRSVSKDELLDLYQIIKSAETIALYDAAEAIGHKDVATACEKIAEAKTRYERKHARTLARHLDTKASVRQQEKAANRRRKVEDALQKLAEYHAALQRMVKIQRAKPAPKSDGSTLIKLQAAKAKAPRVVKPTPGFLRRFGAVDQAATLEVAKSEYELLTIRKAADLIPNTLFLIRSKATWHLLRSPVQPQATDKHSFINILTEKEIAVSISKLLAASDRQQAFRLRPLQSPLEQIVLDESELNVLWAVVRDTKLMPNASEITMIKKNELRRKQYDRALKKMLLLQRSFNAAARGKRNQFRRELAMLEEKKQSMSLREVEKRKLQIAQETRLLERADAHFIKVMNSLHALNSRIT